MSGGFEEIPHTADRAIRVWGDTLPELFVFAARGMYSLAGLPEDEVGEEEEMAVEVEAATLEGLLVAWLNELLYLTETRKLSFRAFHVDELLLPSPGGVMASPEEEESPPVGPQLAGLHQAAVLPEEGEARLRGRARGRRSTAPPAMRIKAATYHNLRIEREGGRYVTEVVFDV